MLGSLVEKALEGQDLRVIRADQISKPGMISAQVIDYVLRSRVVVADLSYHNPNVFYELSLRHVTGLPTVHIIRSDDRIPFDLANFRTVTIDTTDKYNLVARLDSYRSEIANHVRQAIAAGTSQDNPIRAFHPNSRCRSTKPFVRCFNLGGGHRTLSRSWSPRARIRSSSMDRTL